MKKNTGVISIVNKGLFLLNLLYFSVLCVLVFAFCHKLNTYKCKIYNKNYIQGLSDSYNHGIFLVNNFFITMKGRNMSFSTIKKAAALSLILFTFTMFVGCGGDEAQIKSVAKKFVSATKKGDLDKMVSCMSKESKKGFEMFTKDEKMKKEMAEQMKKEGKKISKVSYGKVTIDGDKAELEMKATIDGKEESDPMKFIKEDGKWVIAEM